MAVESPSARSVEYWILGTGCQHLDLLIVKLAHCQVCCRSREKMAARVFEVILMQTNQSFLRNRTSRP